MLFLQENIRLMPDSENILTVSYLLLSTYLLLFFYGTSTTKRSFILAGKVSSISVQDVQDKVCGRTENASLHGRSVAEERVK